MLKEIAFADLERLLQSTGFVRAPTSGSHIVFERAGSGIVIVLPTYQNDATVRPVHVIAVRQTLIANGLIDADTFDKRLEKVSSHL